MKVVLFCGGLGTRLREHSHTVPKPLVDIGYRPILWHLMRYFAHFGHKEFILCLGHRGDMIKDYFLNYNECLSNDFVLSEGGRKIDLISSDIEDWRITFVDTGVHTDIGGRLRAVQSHLEGCEMFIASYSDSLTNADLDDYVRKFRQSGKTAGLLAARPTQSFHTVRVNDGSLVSEVRSASDSELWINGGFFLLRRGVFDHLRAGEDLVAEPLQRLIELDQLYAYRYRGYWDCMDTYKDKKRMDEMFERGELPWAVWEPDVSPGQEALS